MMQLLPISILLTAVCLCCACDRKIIYDHYAHTPIAGWEKNDTLFFDIKPIAEDGVYRQELGLRINGSYPFKKLRLIVEQHQHPGNSIRHDTLDCELIDDKGNPKGQGICYYQYALPIGEINVRKGDSLHIGVRHSMKRFILPGIADIGIKMTRKN